MLDLTRTTTVLLDGLFDASNDDAWREFDQRYRPIVEAFARRLGLSDADAADAAQDTMTQFLLEYRAGKYDRARGRLRAWLVTLARTRVAAIYRKRDRARERPAGSQMIDLTDEHHLTRIWDDERRQVILRAAWDRLRTSTKLSPQSLEIFDLLVAKQMPVPSVAERLGVSEQDVYLAKSRVAQRLRGFLDEIERAYDEAP